MPTVTVDGAVDATGAGALSLRLPRWLTAALLAGWTALIWTFLASAHPPLEPSFPGAGVLFNAAHAVR